MTESGRGNLLTVHAAPRRPGGAGQAVAGIGTDGTGSRGAWEAVQGLRRMPQGEPSHDSTLLCYHVSCRPGGSLRPLVIHWRRAGGAVAGVLSPVDRHAVGIFVGDCRRRWYRWSRHRLSSGHVRGRRWSCQDARGMPPEPSPMPSRCAGAAQRMPTRFDRWNRITRKP